MHILHQRLFVLSLVSLPVLLFSAVTFLGVYLVPPVEPAPSKRDLERQAWEERIWEYLGLDPEHYELVSSLEAMKRYNKATWMKKAAKSYLETWFSPANPERPYLVAGYLLAAAALLLTSLLLLCGPSLRGTLCRVYLGRLEERQPYLLASVWTQILCLLAFAVGLYILSTLEAVPRSNSRAKLLDLLVADVRVWSVLIILCLASAWFSLLSLWIGAPKTANA